MDRVITNITVGIFTPCRSMGQRDNRDSGNGSDNVADNHTLIVILVTNDDNEDMRSDVSNWDLKWDVPFNYSKWQDIVTEEYGPPNRLRISITF